MCSSPLGSPTDVSKRPYVHAPGVLPTRAPLATARAGVRVRDWGMGTGWVVGGVYRVYYPAARGGSRYSEAGPGSPSMGLEWVVPGAGRPCAVTHPGTHPCGARSPTGSLVPGWALNAASWPIRARFTSFSIKLSQNGQVSPENVEKASHSPYSQNGSQISPLEILRFTFSAAFSPKELMVAF